MPIYKYECNECAHIFEDLRSFSEPDPDQCPQCGAPSVRKLVSGGNFVLKGGGWYVTDYAKSSSDAANATPTPADAPASSGKAGAGSDTSDGSASDDSAKSSTTQTKAADGSEVA